MIGDQYGEARVRSRAFVVLRWKAPLADEVYRHGYLCGAWLPAITAAAATQTIRNKLCLVKTWPADHSGSSLRRPRANGALAFASRIAGHQPAVDRNDRAGEVRGRRQAQAQRHVRDLFRKTVAAERRAA